MSARIKTAEDALRRLSSMKTGDTVAVWMTSHLPNSAGIHQLQSVPAWRRASVHVLAEAVLYLDVVCDSGVVRVSWVDDWPFMHLIVGGEVDLSTLPAPLERYAVSPDDRREALRRLQAPEPLKLGQTVYFLTAEVCEGCEGSKEPIIDPHSFQWLPGIVTELESTHDGVLCARVSDADTGVGLYERRFILTENEWELLGIRGRR